MARQKTEPARKSIQTKKPKHRPKPNPRPSNGLTLSRRRHRPGTIAVREIARFQRTFEPILSRRLIRRLVRDTMEKVNQELHGGHQSPSSRSVSRVQPLAIDAVRESTEYYIIEVLAQSNLLAAHGKRVTLQPRDLELYLRMVKQYSKNRLTE